MALSLTEAIDQIFVGNRKVARTLTSYRPRRVRIVADGLRRNGSSVSLDRHCGTERQPLRWIAAEGHTKNFTFELRDQSKRFSNVLAAAGIGPSNVGAPCYREGQNLSLPFLLHGALALFVSPTSPLSTSRPLSTDSQRVIRRAGN